MLSYGMDGYAPNNLGLIIQRGLLTNDRFIRLGFNPSREDISHTLHKAVLWTSEVKCFCELFSMARRHNVLPYPRRKVSQKSRANHPQKF